MQIRILFCVAKCPIALRSISSEGRFLRLLCDRRSGNARSCTTSQFLPGEASILDAINNRSLLQDLSQSVASNRRCSSKSIYFCPRNRIDSARQARFGDDFRMEIDDQRRPLQASSNVSARCDCRPECRIPPALEPGWECRV
jgi:hypothetical protein